jgi:hypothetical protein
MYGTIMAMQNFLVTVDFDKVGDDAHVDLRELVGKVPTARILSGDPTVSVKVSVDAGQGQALKDVVGGSCVIDEYADLDLYQN